jgi:hypothetical protein
MSRDICTLDEAKAELRKMDDILMMAVKRGNALIAAQQLCLDELFAEARYGVHGGGSGPNLARKIMDATKQALA